MSILEKTMKQMPKSFTSNEFNNMAVKNGYPKEKLQRKGLSGFIKRYADNAYLGSKTWIKRSQKHKEVKEEKKGYQFDNIEQILIFVKSKGYKILKPVNEWVEC